MKFKCMPHKLLIPALFLLLLCGCHNDAAKHENAFADLRTDSTLRYAKRFSIASNDHVTAVYLFGNRTNRDTTAVFYICKDSLAPKKGIKNAYLLRSPCKKIAALSSIYASMLCDLHALDALTAIDNVDYITNPRIIDKFNAHHLDELSKGPQPDLERLIALHPDVVFSFGMGNPDSDLDPKLRQTGIPVAVSVDHLEATPLARAEWIKFFAAFVDKQPLADSIFSETEKSYFALKDLAQQAAEKPTVFSEIKYSDAWYLPGGKSFMAQLISDAHADYLWKNDTNAGSLPLSFEQVYARARNADYWLNPSMVTNKAELLSYESRYGAFKAFKDNHVYNNNKNANAKGYAPYWETGMIYPNRILSDLIYIFHPGLRAQLKNDLYYYRQIN